MVAGATGEESKLVGMAGARFLGILKSLVDIVEREAKVREDEAALPIAAENNVLVDVLVLE